MKLILESLKTKSNCTDVKRNKYYYNIILQYFMFYTIPTLQRNLM